MPGLLLSSFVLGVPFEARRVHRAPRRRHRKLGGGARRSIAALLCLAGCAACSATHDEPMVAQGAAGGAAADVDDGGVDGGGSASGGAAGSAGNPENPQDMPDGGFQRGDLSGLPARALIRVQGYGVPLGDAGGITCDGDHAWVANRGHNAGTHTLMRVHLPTSEITHEYEFSDLNEQLGTGLGGLADDGERIWMAISGNVNKLVVVAKESGEVVRTLSSPSTLGPVDLDFVGEDLWLAAGTGDVFRINPINGGVQEEFHLGGSERDFGVAVRDGEMYLGNLFGGMWVHALDDFTVLANVTDSDGAQIDRSKVGPMCFNGDLLRVLSDVGVTEYEVQ